MSLQVAALTGLTDAEILAATVRAAADERAATVHLIALLAELDTRRLYLAARVLVAVHLLHARAASL